MAKGRHLSFFILKEKQVPYFCLLPLDICLLISLLKSSACFDKIERLLLIRHKVGAAVTRHDNRAAGIAHARRAPPIPALEVAIDKAARKGVTRAQRVVDFDRERRGL